MILRLFKGYQAYLLILIPLAGFFLWLNSFFMAETELSGRYVFMPLSQAVFKLLGYNTFISKIFAYSLLLFNGFLLVRLNIVFNFIRARTYLPAVIYIILLSFVDNIQRLSPALMASVFIIFAIDKLMSTFKKERLAIQIMDASLLVSVASLFYFPAFFLIILLWIGLVLIRPFRWREWVFTIFGMVTPYLLLAGIKYTVGSDMEIPIKSLVNEPFILNWGIENSIYSIIFFTFLIFIILLASFQLLKLFGTKKVHSRRFYVFFLWLFSITFALYFILPSTSIEILYINAIPLSFLLAHYFIHLNSEWLAEVFFMGLIALVIINKVIGA